MGRTVQVRGLRLMKSEEICGRNQGGMLKRRKGWKFSPTALRCGVLPADAMMSVPSCSTPAIETSPPGTSTRSCNRSYNCLAGRSRRVLPGMMLHQDGSTHGWVPGRWWDLTDPLDDATGESAALSSSPKRAPCRASGGFARWSRPRDCSARSIPTAAVTTGTRRTQAVMWTWTIRPRSAAPSLNRASS